MQEDKQETHLSITPKIGDAVNQIESSCSLSKVDFLKSTYNLKKINEISKNDDFKQILGLVLTKISVLAGIKGEIDSFTKQDISKMILSSFKELSLEEISKAFELERYGIYEDKTDHYQLFDSNYISTVLNKYKKWKISEKKELNISAPKLETSITDSEKQQLREDLLKMIYGEIKDTGFCSDAWHIYTDLESFGRINPTTEEKKKLYREQLKIYEIEEKALIKTKYDPFIIKTHLKYLSDKVSSKTPVESVSNKCRSIIASNYLKDYVDSFENFKNQIK